MQGDIDLDAGAILTGRHTLASMGEEIRRAIVATVNGTPTCSELRGNREFAIRRTSYPVAR